MILPSLAGLLAALVAFRALDRLRPVPRSSRPPRTRVRRSRRATPDYASLLDRVARRVRSGSTLTSAVVDEIEPFTAFRQVAEQLRAGSPLTAVLAIPSPADPDLALTVQALSATAHLGGPVAATLDEAAAVLRERTAARAERRVHASQARLSARVLTIVPLGFAGWNAVTSQRTQAVYLSSIVGGTCAACGLILNLVGWRWMRKIIGPS